MTTEREQLAFLLGITCAARAAHDHHHHHLEHQLLEGVAEVNKRTHTMDDHKTLDTYADELANALPELWEKQA